MSGQGVNEVKQRVAALLGQDAALAFEVCVRDLPPLEQPVTMELALRLLELQVQRLTKTKLRDWSPRFRRLFALDAVQLAHWEYYGGLEGIRSGTSREAWAFWHISETLFQEVVARRIERWLEGLQASQRRGDLDDHVMNVCELAEQRFVSKVLRKDLDVADTSELKAFLYGPVLTYSLRDYKRRYWEEMGVAETLARAQRYHTQAVIDGLVHPLSVEQASAADYHKLRRGEVAISALVDLASEDPAVWDPRDPGAFLGFLKRMSGKDCVGQIAEVVLNVFERLDDTSIKVVLARLRTNPPAPHREVALEAGVTSANSRKIYSRVLQSVEAQLTSLVRESLDEGPAPKGNEGGIDRKV